LRTAVRKRFVPTPGEAAAEKQILAMIRASWPILEAGVNAPAAMAALQSSDVERFIRAMPWQEFIQQLGQVADPMIRQIDRTVSAAVGDLEGAAARLAFENQDVVSIKYGQLQSAKLIKGITAAQEQTYREIITRALQGDLTVDSAARAIRRTIGLHPAWANAVEGYRERQWALNIIDKKMSPAKAQIQADKQAERYAERLIKRRAETIARTEIQTAQNLGRFATWAQTIGSGAARSDSRKEWSAGPGCCKLCHRLSGQIVLWDAAFSNGHIMPPAHPNCRCTAVLLPNETMGRLVPNRTIDWTSPILATPDDLADMM
jgi:Phage Mu protein F like protein